jgi:hypothetical protein
MERLHCQKTHFKGKYLRRRRKRRRKKKNRLHTEVNDILQGYTQVSSLYTPHDTV